jgi:phosphomannomutase
MPQLMVSVSGVRGIVGQDLNPLVVSRWAMALSELLSPGPVVLGRDSRPSGVALGQAAASIFRSLGREVWDIGVVPTPTVQLAVEHWGAAGGLILSASHNPAPWNACKFVDDDGSFLTPVRFERLKELQQEGRAAFVAAGAYGGILDRHEQALELHLHAVLTAVDVHRIRAARLSVLLHTGHGAGGTLLPRLAHELGVALDGRSLEPNGDLAPNPEPTSASLVELVQTAAPSTAFAAMVDPDADRLAVALPGTPYLGEEWTLPLVVRHRLATRRGPVVTNLSTSSRIEAAAGQFGVRVVRTPVGEAHVVGAMKAEAALIGGEGNGGVIDPAVHLGRDAAVAMARLCEAEACSRGGLRALAAEFPPRFLLKEKVSVSADELTRDRPHLETLLGPVTDDRDGLRWSRPDGFVHIRASNTEPIVRALAEAESDTGARDILDTIRRILTAGEREAG